MYFKHFNILNNYISIYKCIVQISDNTFTAKLCYIWLILITISTFFLVLVVNDFWMIGLFKKQVVEQETQLLKCF